MKIQSDIQDTYMPAPGEVEEAYCGVCGAKMIAHRDQYGPTNFVSAIAKSKRHHDYFECPHRKQDWHKKVIDIRHYMREVPSDALCNVMRLEVDQILRKAWEEAGGLDPHGEMWLRPEMHAEADKIEAGLNGNTSGISTERPG